MSGQPTPEQRAFIQAMLGKLFKPAAGTTEHTVAQRAVFALYGNEMQAIRGLAEKTQGQNPPGDGELGTPEQQKLSHAQLALASKAYLDANKPNASEALKAYRDAVDVVEGLTDSQVRRSEMAESIVSQFGNLLSSDADPETNPAPADPDDAPPAPDENKREEKEEKFTPPRMASEQNVRQLQHQIEQLNEIWRRIDSAKLENKGFLHAFAQDWPAFKAEHLDKIEAEALTEQDFTALKTALQNGGFQDEGKKAQEAAQHAQEFLQLDKQKPVVAVVDTGNGAFKVNLNLHDQQKAHQSVVKNLLRRLFRPAYKPDKLAQKVIDKHASDVELSLVGDQKGMKMIAVQWGDSNKNLMFMLADPNQLPGGPNTDKRVFKANEFKPGDEPFTLNSDGKPVPHEKIDPNVLSGQALANGVADAFMEECKNSLFASHKEITRIGAANADNSPGLRSSAGLRAIPAPGQRSPMPIRASGSLPAGDPNSAAEAESASGPR